jgi:putative sigma-54 modulation protein
MDIKIHGENLAITEALRDSIKQEVSHLKLFNQAQKIEVRLVSYSSSKEANVNIHYKGQDIHVCSKNPDMYKAIYDVMSKLQRKIVSMKEGQKHKKGFREATKEFISESQTELEYETEQVDYE